MNDQFPSSLAARLENKSAVFGAWLFLREPMVAEVASKTGYDYVCIDMQHGLMNLDTAMTMLAHIETGDAIPLARVTTLDNGQIGRVLDSGALGVIIPMVNTVAQAEAAVRACRYAPAGDRSVGPIGAIMRYGNQYFRAAQDIVTVIPMIETAEAIDNVEEIAAVDGVGALYVGPADLSMSMGYKVGMDQPDPEFDAALRKVVAACKANGIIAGIQASPELVAKRIDQGFQMITVGYDQGPMHAALKADLAASLDHINNS